MSDTIESLLAEGRTFPPSPSLHRPGARPRPLDLRRGRGRLRGVLGPAGRASSSTGSSRGTTVLEWDLPVREVVRRRQAQRVVQLPRPPRRRRPRRPGRVPLGRRAGRHPHDHLRRAPRRRVPPRQRAQGARRPARATGSTSTSAWCPSCPTALLACARIGAPHSVVFGGFSSDSLRDRIQDAEAKVLVTGDGAWRRGERRAAQGRRPTPRWPSARRSRRCSCCGAPATTSP